MARSLIQIYSPDDNLFKIKNNKDPFNTSLNNIKQYAGKFDSHFFVNSLLIKDNKFENSDVN
jgi:hypothetical protein